MQVNTEEICTTDIVNKMLIFFHELGLPQRDPAWSSQGDAAATLELQKNLIGCI